MREILFKPFEEMRDRDYADVGFKSGLEIHQQLLTTKKLFCRCPAGRYSTNHDAEILRHMRPTLSELGEYDGTALMEFKTKKEIIYRINRETVCTYEMDDTPPFEINDDALDIALGISMLYGASIVDEIHIARKQYLDGSIPTGFQRTAIVSLDGHIPYKNREVKVVQLSIEEDSCREVSDVGHRRIYNTDRLGMPLIETVTEPAMRTPLEVAEVGEICRRLARSTGRVRTGIGAARQDVNVSVTRGTRIEIKGVPRIPRIPLLTYNEGMRQWNLLRMMDELHRRGITHDAFSSSTENVSKLLRRTQYQPIRNALDQGMTVNCVLLRGFKGLLGWQTQTGTTFSKEISDRVRVIACLTTLPNILHSDSTSESLLSSEWQALKKNIGATSDDTIVVVWGSEQDAATGAKEIVNRAKEATAGIPSETRQALRDGTNGFERILPGPDRMYPDTDLPPKQITGERRESIRLSLPAPVWDRERWYTRLGIPRDTIQPLAISPLAGLFELLVKEMKVDPTLAAVVLVQFPKRLRRRLKQPVRLDPEILKKIFRAYVDGTLLREGILPAIEQSMKKGLFSMAGLTPIRTKKELLSIVTRAKKKAEKIPISDTKRMRRYLMGVVMHDLRGRANGSDVAKLVSQKKRTKK
jgi:glutamyl-tRNA(Gln) amidotransferase subunit E